ncbi:MAG: N-acetylglucosamine-6-phosphate deacetylase [Clostridia bacterium]|nr:N-acetylglucosamine-6-phosphate deacetylase [Clostridia bacterium]
MGIVIKNAYTWQENGDFCRRDLYVENGRFVSDCPADEVIDATGLYLCPGLVDVHSHGRAGYDFCDADEAGLLKMAADYAANGVTALCPTLASDTFENWKKAAKRVEKTASPAFVGLHLEGRYLSPEKRGAHAAELLSLPCADEVNELAELVSLPLRVSYAPELDADGSFAAALREKGISLSMGHTNADYQTAMTAIDRGVTAATHLFNAMPPLHHRAGGPLAAALNEDVFAELICDGIHVAPETVKLAYRAKGERLVLISDSMAGTGCPDGDYSIAGMRVILKDGKALTTEGALAGSTANLLDEVRNLATFAGISFGKALYNATAAPAALLGLAEKLGCLCTGARADLILLEKDSLDRLGARPLRVMQAGAWHQ